MTTLRLPGLADARVDPAALEAALATFEEASLAAAGWAVTRVERKDPQMLVLYLSPTDPDTSGVKGVALEWLDHGGEEIRAFEVGPQFAASYRRAPGTWDIGDEETPDEPRRIAHRACAILAGLEGDFRLTELSEEEAAEATAAMVGPPPPAPEDPLPDDPIDRLVACVDVALRAELGSDLFPDPDGWRVDEVRPFEYWRKVCDVRLERGDRKLAFILFPHDPAESVYARSERFDIVYYSDDYTPDQHHEHLYDRDNAMVDRFVAWFRDYDRRGGCPL